MKALLAEYETARAAKDKELAAAEHIRISAYNPRKTMQWDDERRAARVSALMKWTEQWWAARGRTVVWQKGSKFNVPAFDVQEKRTQ